MYRSNSKRWSMSKSKKTGSYLTDMLEDPDSIHSDQMALARYCGLVWEAPHRSVRVTLLSGRHGRLREFPPPRRNLLFYKPRKESVEMRRRVNHIGKHKGAICVVLPIGRRRTDQ